MLLRGRWYFCEYRGKNAIRKKSYPTAGKAKENWRIIRALSEKLGFVPNWLDLNGLRTDLFKEIPLFSMPNKIIEVPWETAEKQKKLVSKTPLAGYIKNYYLSNSICRASKTMGTLARARNSLNFKEAS